VIVLDLLRQPERHRYGSDHRVQRADLYLPRGAGPHPVVVVLHGGNWRARYGKLVTKSISVDLAKRGVAAWNVEYRRVGRGQGGGWPATFDDVAAAIDLLPEVSGGRLDTGDVRVVGHSAGGQLALWAASRGGISRVVALAAPSNLRAAGADGRALMGGSPDEVPERYAAADPRLLLPLGVPTLLVHGTEDTTVPVRRSRRYAEEARAAGDSVELVEPVPGNHRVHIDPRSEAWRVAAEFLTRPAGDVGPFRHPIEG
jgi:acetyl esterase/lipase